MLSVIFLVLDFPAGCLFFRLGFFCFQIDIFFSRFLVPWYLRGYEDTRWD